MTVNTEGVVRAGAEMKERMAKYGIPGFTVLKVSNPVRITHNGKDDYLDSLMDTDPETLFTFFKYAKKITKNKE